MAFPGASTVHAQHSTFTEIQGNVVHYGHNVQNINAVYNERETKLEKIKAFLKPIDHQGSCPTRCLDGTRLDIFRKIHRWLDRTEGPNILLLTGHPGAGKSSVASSMDQELQIQQRLGASFFIRHDNANLSDPNSIWPSVAYNLSKFNNNLMDALLKIAESRKVDPSRPDIDLHFEYLIEKILHDEDSYLSHKPPVVLIDALDEIPQSRQRNVFICTLEKWAELPMGYKLLITSRNENIPRSLLNHCACIELSSGHSVSSEAHDDIWRFFVDGFKFIRENHDFLDVSWPEEQTIQKLTKQSAGLFVWAKTALDFIESGTPTGRLDEILMGESMKGDIDELYKRILELSISNLRAHDQKVAKSALSTILLSKVPIQKQELHHFLGEDVHRHSVEFLLKRLSSVISIALDDTVQFGHLSFADFLCDSARCNPTIFAFYKADETKNLFHRCMRLMTNQLHFNICDVQSSYLLNKDIPTEEIQKHISKSLSYACVYWARHLEDTASLGTVDKAISETVSKFLKVQLLYWLEVMSYLKQVPSAVAVLYRVANVFRNNTEIEKLAVDAQKFVKTFRELLTISAPHIYVSELPFSPQGSEVYKNFIERYPRTITFDQGAEVSWPATVTVIEGHTDNVTSVAYSPDGRHVVSGSWDNTVRIWDVNTGEMVSGPFEGHTDHVASVAYSPDGRHVVSGSWDKTVRIWDVNTGEIVSGPFEGHTSSVTSVAYSSDGRHAVSGSWDKTVRIWDVNTGEMVFSPFEDHTNCVASVVYSPDGRHVVSGSWDKTVRIWDVNTGEMVFGPFEGHTGPVASVAYSTSGRHVVSVSWDGAVRIWDVNSGEMVSGPLEGHTGSVASVVYSPDGRHVVSGAWDKTVMIWDINTGEMVSGPFEDHTDVVASVEYSPDGRHVVSGSWDNTVRIWDVKIEEMVCGPFEGHTNYVTSVAYSPCGRHVVSGSLDKTVRIWDVSTGEMVSGPFEGHTNCVAYSPDGRHIVSGSWDNTVRIWDAGTEEMVCGPFEGHTDEVTSVAFSPDGRHVVSGSWDNTVRIWDVNTGEMVFGPFEGHTDHVASVAYSPDGRHVVSGSWDKTVRIWDVNTGEMVSGPFEGHACSVTSVAYSPDGKHVVSVSQHSTVSIWDVNTGEMVSGPFGGDINCVAYSPDGRHVVSGSYDKVRIWDVNTGEMVSGPYEGHTDYVVSAAYSPDGRYVVSGSWDKTVRIWEVNPGEMSLTLVPKYYFSEPEIKKLETHQCLSTTTISQSSQQDIDQNYNPLPYGFTVDYSHWCSSTDTSYLFWVPPHLVLHLCGPETAMTFGKPLRKLNFTKFVHGSSWMNCVEHLPQLTDNIKLMEPKQISELTP